MGSRDAVDTLVLDLLEWLGADGRPYGEVMELWRTSCPRLDVWERCMSERLLRLQLVDGVGLWVYATDAGRARLHRERPEPLVEEGGTASVVSA